MILVDTNVLSELMRPEPSPGVIAWMDEHSREIRISAISVAEIGLGIELLPEGRRREGLAVAARQMFEEDFSDRCHAFDAEAAFHFARIVADRRRIGRPISTQDAQIAAIALSGQLTLATRNLADFEDIPELSLIDPWAG